MTNAFSSTAKVTTHHQTKVAYVYVRQSSLGQILHHSESTAMQYQLTQRATALGWPPDRVKTIDDDLGKSGSAGSERTGFQFLLAEIGLGRVGMVVSMDASRLARNNRDWYQLLELCSLFGTLMADSETLYDPRNYHDRLLLGLSGMMSEAELHQLRLRLHAGELHKAQRGELRLGLPAGLSRDRTGTVILEPDGEVQARLRLVFETFTRLGSARAVLRYLHTHAFALPVRPVRGPDPYPIQWQPASASRVLAILRNPAYAGAYVYGRTTMDASRRTAGHPHSGMVRLPQDQWAVLLHDRYPAYIPWSEFMHNQHQLALNQNRPLHDPDGRGAARKGMALLQGMVVCGRCGARMRTHYSGSASQFPVYSCQETRTAYADALCLQVRALGLDQEIAAVFLAALAPDRIALAIEAVAQLEADTARVAKQWHLRLERAHFDADRAYRQYMLVEPENRLVARSLEQAWEEHLRAVERVEMEYHTWQQHHPTALSDADRQHLLHLGQDLPQVWADPQTTHAERKMMLRLVVQQVIVDQDREKGKVWFQINWQTGATSQHSITRRVRSYTDYADGQAVEARIRELVAAQRLDAEIAATLNSEGYHTATGRTYTSKLIWMLRNRWGISSAKPNGINPRCWEEDSYSVEGAAQAIGVLPGAIFKWLRTGRIHGQQLGKGMPWKVFLTPAEIGEMQKYVARVRRSKKEAV